MDYDILISKVTLRHREGLYDVGINKGKITAIEPYDESKTYTDDERYHIVGGEGFLLTESFINGHLHLDKVYTLEKAGEDALKSYTGQGMGSAMSGIEKAANFKASYNESWIYENVKDVCFLAKTYGNTHIRAFADVDTKARLEGVKALLRAKKDYQHWVDLQVVAFPQDGIARESGAKELVREALELGADVVGGIPWIEFDKQDEQDHVDSMCALAKEFSKPISMLCDDVGDSEERTLEMLCKRTIQMGWQGRVTAQHCRAMQLYPENYFRKLVALLKTAQIGIVSDPHTGPLCARVKDLIKAGVPVALGQDDIADAYYPFGRCNMLEVAFLAAHILQMLTQSDMELLYDMITTTAAKVLGIKNHELKVGGNANLVLLPCKSVYEAIWLHRAPLCVIKDGNLIRGYFMDYEDGVWETYYEDE